MVFRRENEKRNILKENLYKESYKEDFPYSGPNTLLIDDFEKRTSKNLVVYSGYSPFVGSGIDIGGWSFVVDIDKGKKLLDNHRTEPLEFELSEIYAKVDDEIESLDIPNLSICDKVFINGKRIRKNRELLPEILGHPINQVSDEFLHKIMNQHETDARFYRVIQVTDWDGDLVLTAFLRFQKSKRSLFVENNYFLLPPISDSLRSVDTIKEKYGFRHTVFRILGIFLKTFTHTLGAILNLFKEISEAISDLFSGSKEYNMKKIVKSSPDFDYGAKTSIREAVSQILYSQHFQKLDKERYFKTIEKRIFNMLTEFLDEKNIDNSEFKERETSILNNGVLVTGGNLKADNIAVGKKSSINNILKGVTNQK